MSVFDRFMLETNQAIRDITAKVMSDKGEVDLEKKKKKSETAQSVAAEGNTPNQIAPIQLDDDEEPDLL